MLMAAGVIWFSLIVWFLLLAAVAALQVFLSLRKSKWPGLGLPGICFAASLIALIGNVLYDFQCTLSVLAGDFFKFLAMNVPTLLLWGIYTLCRRKMAKRDELERMRIQDLE